MAFNEFYMNQNAGSSDLNSGSTCSDVGGLSDAPIYTSLAGDFDGTSIFTPNDGSNPVSAGVAVGMWANFYNTGDLQVRCVAKITAVTNATNGTITLDTANKYGNVPAASSGAHTRAIKVGGAWNSSAVLTTRLNNITIPTSTHINIKAATYPSLASQNWGFTQTAGITVWFRGYKTTPGDLDTVPSGSVAAATPGVDCPYFTWSANGLIVKGDSIVTSLAMTSASTTGPTLQTSSSNVKFHRMIVTASGANALSNAVKIGGASNEISSSFLKASSSAAVISSAVAVDLHGNWIQGGLTAISVAGGQILFNLIDSPATDAIVQGVNVAMTVFGDTFYNVGGNSIMLLSTLTTGTTIRDNLFHSCNVALKYLVNFAGSTDMGCVMISGNSVWNCTAGLDANGFSTGLGDMPALRTIAEATDPLPNVASHNFQYAGTTGKGLGFPPYYQSPFILGNGVAFATNRDFGVANHVDPTGGGAGVNRAALPSGVSSVG